METGSEAAAKMAKLDAQAGMADPVKTAAGNTAAENVQGILGDTDIARNLVAQAEQMKAQMVTLQAEAERLMEEAANLDPSLSTKKKRGRPAKAKA